MTPKHPPYILLTILALSAIKKESLIFLNRRITTKLLPLSGSVFWLSYYSHIQRILLQRSILKEQFPQSLHACN